jgi:hypothetical protein
VRRCVATSAPGESALLLRKLLLRERRPLLALLDSSARVPIENVAYSGGRFRGTFESPRAPAQWPDSCEFLIPSRGALLSFRASVAASAGTLELGLPTRLTHSGFRSSFRGAGRVGTVAWRSARASGLALDARLEDVSLRGFSFVAPAAERLVPDERLDVELSIPDARFGATVTLTSVARARGGAWLCGARLDLERLDHHVAWRDFVLHTVLPGVHVGGAELADDAWRVLETSRYLQSWTSAAERQALAAQHREAWQRTPRAHGHLLVGRERDGRATATVATHRIYERTWLCHHLGADAGRSVKDRLELLHGMYRGLIHASQHAGVEYLLIYNQQKDHWVDVVYGKFAEQYAAPGSLLFDGYRLFKLELEAALAAAPGATCAIEDAEPRWSDAVARALQGGVTALERDAFDHADPLLSGFGAECARLGRRRARRVLVASRDSALLGGLVLELGEDGENVFGLMSRCSFLPGTSSELDVRRALLVAAAREYQRAGARQAVLLEREACEPDAYTDVGWQHVSLGVRWLAKLSELPVWLDYLEQSLGLRQGAGRAVTR